ncbi:Rad3-related DNA helicase-like protein [mine drainage metagenome]|uniref:Rad3-related DNA helicase-like protein n=2 Tax=mine drainage metagenome TaxID=410659 RepID=T0ZVK6_9ZZZZ
MPALKLRVPRIDVPAYGEATLSQAVKEAVTEALSDVSAWPAPRQPLSSLPAEAVTIWISDAQHAVLSEVAKAHHFDGLGPAATALLHAKAYAARRQAKNDDTGDHAPVSADATTLDRINAALGNETRPDQALFYTRLMTELNAGNPAHEVIAAEASTGIGKTRVFIAAMMDWSNTHPGETAVLSAPNYNVLLQAVTLWHRLRGVMPGMPEAITLLGQQEYVSATALQRILDDSPETPGHAEARRWLAAGGPAADDDLLGHRWLVRNLRRATGDQWRLSAHVQLNSDIDHDDPGYAAYMAQFADAREVQWVFCTHAMLATDVRRRTVQAKKEFRESNSNAQSVSEAAYEQWVELQKEDRKHSLTWQLQNDLLATMASADAGRLPRIGLLVVDEAHLLEESFARAFANGASVSALMRSMRSLHEAYPKLVKGGDLEEMESIWNSLKVIGENRAGDTVLANDLPGVTAAVGAMFRLLSAILARKKPAEAQRMKELHHLMGVRRSLEIANKSQGERFGMATRVSWSPSAIWPTIEVGRYDVSRELDFLWSLVVKDRSVLVSATLYEEVSKEGLGNTRKMLSIRYNMLRPMVPVRPNWLFEPVTLFMPADTQHPDGLKRFRRPTERQYKDRVLFAEQTERWRNDVARYVAEAYASGAGGMLVLMTSHAERVQLENRLQGRMPSDCVISQHEGSGLEDARRRFLNVIANGRRPCLLGVGSAWTGLDLSGDGLAAITGRHVAESEDQVVTDLIIPTAPIGTNRSLTQAWRKERMGMVAEVGATSLMFRQGIGRLVRREGLPRNRRLHFLDTRIYDPAWRLLLQPVVKALAPYRRRVMV